MPQQYVKIDKLANYAIITLHREPVNSMNLDVWIQLQSALTECEKDSNMRGIIINSGLQKHIFSAGNDLNELYAPNTSRDRYQSFWAISNTFLANLYRSRLITVAAIKGACPAGGCVIALCCDYRIMTNDNKSVIGLNEVALGMSHNTIYIIYVIGCNNRLFVYDTNYSFQLMCCIGIPVPKYWIELMVRTIGHRNAEYILQRALQPVSSEALRLGLVDKLVSIDELIPSAEAELKQWLSLQDAGRINTKNFLRQSISDQWIQFTANEGETAWNRLASESTVKSLGAVMARLSGGKKNAKL